jgi:hypothetical protein
MSFADGDDVAVRTALGKRPRLRVNTRSRSRAALAQLVEHIIRN